MTDERTEIQKAVDEIIHLVRSTPVGEQRGDSAALIMLSAYLHGFRRLVAIRTLAGTHAGTEAMILARSLLSLAARAAYVDAPDDPAERRRRFLQYRARDLRNEIRTTRALARSGFDVSSNTSAQEQELAEIGDVGTFPEDTHLMREHVNLAPFHARLYGPGSDHVHFSQRIALEPVRGVENVDLDAGDSALADEALALAALAFGELLTRSERAVGHGLADRVFELIAPAIPESEEDGS